MWGTLLRVPALERLKDKQVWTKKDVDELVEARKKLYRT